MRSRKPSRLGERVAQIRYLDHGAVNGPTPFDGNPFHLDRTADVLVRPLGGRVVRQRVMCCCAAHKQLRGQSGIYYCSHHCAGGAASSCREIAYVNVEPAHGRNRRLPEHGRNCE